jgi:NADH:ubiquinone oxidoreductase subunit 6 (subunit J)
MQTIICQPAASPALFSAEGVVGIIFLVTIALMVTGALIAVHAQRLVRAVAGLAVCFTGLAGIYYFLLSPFVAMMQLLIYVGAVSIVIVLGIMLAFPEEAAPAGERPTTEVIKHRSALAGPVAASIAGLMFAALSVLGLKTEWQVFPREGEGDMHAIGITLLTTHGMVFELISIVLVMTIIGALVLAQRGRN